GGRPRGAPVHRRRAPLPGRAGHAEPAGGGRRRRRAAGRRRPATDPRAAVSRLGRPGATGARQAVAFLTPVGGGADPMPAALPWFPVVGAPLGIVLGVGLCAGYRWWPACVGR